MNALWFLVDYILPPASLRFFTNSYNTFDPESQSESHSQPHDSPSSTSSFPLQESDLDSDAAVSDRISRPRSVSAFDPHERARHLEADNADLKRRLTRLERELDAERHRHEATRRDSDAHAERYARLSAHTDALQRRLDQQQADVRQYQDAYTHLLADVQSSTLTHPDSLRALQESAEEVKSLKSFLSKTDEWTGAQVMQVVQDLNAEIVQLSASASEEFDLDRKADLTKPSDRELITSSLGPLVFNLLASRDHSQDPTIVQFALQAWEVHCCATHLSSFCFGLPDDVDRFMTRLFTQMHRSEPQPTSSRWRALTHQHARALMPPLDDTRLLHLTDQNIRGILAILAVSGCTDNSGVHRNPLRQRFGSQLVRIADTTRRLAHAIKEGIMSCNFELLSAPHGAEFDGAEMENVYSGLGGSVPTTMFGNGAVPVSAGDQGEVLCTVELGLLCRTHRRLNGDASSGRLEKTLLLRPKVLLESVAEIL